jgi:hypothetical protein
MNRIQQQLVQKKLDGSTNWLTKYGQLNQQLRQTMITIQHFRQAVNESTGLNQNDLAKLE